MAEVRPGRSGETDSAVAGSESSGEGPAPGRAWDPRAVRVTLGAASAHAGLPAIVVEPPDVPVVGSARPVGTAARPGTGTEAGPGTGEVRGARLVIAPPDPSAPRMLLVNGTPVEVDLRILGGERAILVTGAAPAQSHRVLLPPPDGPSRSQGGGTTSREVVVDGWRVEVEVEPAARAALRERASRGRAAVRQSGPTEVRAIIPGVIAAVSVAAGDVVSAGQQLLVIEAMKMQNELRAPRGGTVERVTVGAGATIDVGDLLVVIA